MKILVYGATGATGHAAVRQALLRGHHVTAFARNPTKLTIMHDNLTVTKGELTDNDKIRDLSKTHDVALSALGASCIFKFDQSVVDGIKNIICAMEEVGP